MFASLPDEVIVVRLSADRKGSISFRASMDRPADFTVKARGQNTLVLREGPEHKDQIRFAGEALVIPSGGTVHAEGSELVVADADSVNDPDCGSHGLQRRAIRGRRSRGTM